MPHNGPLGGPRPMIRCNQDVIFELGTAMRSEDQNALQSNLSNNIDENITVEQGLSFDTGATEVRIETTSSTVDNDVFEEYRRELIDQGVQISGWRIGEI